MQDLRSSDTRHEIDVSSCVNREKIQKKLAKKPRKMKKLEEVLWKGEEKS